MDSPEQFGRLTRFVFCYFDQKKQGHVPPAVLGNMLRSLGQVWSFSELVEVMEKHGEKEVTLQAFTNLAQKKREQETRSLHPKHKPGKSAPAEPSYPGLAEAEVQQLRTCFSLFDPDDTSVCSVNDIAQVLTCLGERLSHEDICQLLLLERLEGKEFLTFGEFARLCARI